MSVTADIVVVEIVSWIERVVYSEKNRVMEEHVPF